MPTRKPKSKVAAPPKKRLHRFDRERIERHARTIVDCPAEREAEEIAHAAVMATLRPLFVYPARDVTLLRKYDCWTEANGLRIRTRHGYDDFCFCPRDASQSRRGGCPITIGVPSATADSYGRIALDDADPRAARLLPLLAVHSASVEAHDAARKAAMDAIRTLVAHAYYLHDVEAVWPHARAALYAPIEESTPEAAPVEALAARIAAIVTRPAPVPA